MELWHLGLDIEASHCERLATVLDPAERERAARMRLPLERCRWIAARATMRHILGRATGMAPAELRFDEEGVGKPVLASGGVFFNLSHSGPLALLAIATRPVGVDLELLEHSAERAGDLHLVFSDEERERIARLPPADRPLASYRCWTRKEALLKACGCGFSDDVRNFSVSVDGTARLLASSHPDLAPGEWSLRALEVAGHWTGALAIRGDMPAVHEHHWEGMT